VLNADSLNDHWKIGAKRTDINIRRCSIDNEWKRSHQFHVPLFEMILY
jgi:hypothetical protein